MVQKQRLADGPEEDEYDNYQRLFMNGPEGQPTKAYDMTCQAIRAVYWLKRFFWKNIFYFDFFGCFEGGN